jgi:UDP-N-acetylmuramoyl-L-alanyl-D-glutamate--2,6-diaminopimelate ligase
MPTGLPPGLPISAPEAMSDIAKIDAWLRNSATGNLCADSRTLKPGDVFLAYPLPGAGDGRLHITHALSQGAAAILYDPAQFAWQAEWNAPHLAVPALALHAGKIANAWYHRPDGGMLTLAVTGTNGKTSCALWLGRCFSRTEPACVIGTLGVALLDRGEGEFVATGYTTPDAVLLQQCLAHMRDGGAKTLAIEASSIGLEQGRLDGMHVDIALFTNLTRDHLDFHGDMAAYEAAKNRLFGWPGLRHAVVNLDDAMGMRLVTYLQGRAQSNPNHSAQVLGYSLGDEAALASLGLPCLRASNLKSRAMGTEFHLDTPWGSSQVKTRMIGQFNVSNVLGVLGVMLASGMDLASAVKAVEALQPAPGRMQSLGGQDAPLAVVDYAHTPDALEKTLSALRSVAQERGGQLWCVFGCGGDRDPGKRPQMGKAAQLADQLVVTSDNPRSEEPQQIIAHIINGIDKPFTAMDDRAAAILFAIKQAGKADVVLIAGKGHEPYQEVRGKKLPFSDVEQASLALATRPTMKRGN